MDIDPSAVLALVSNLYGQLATLSKENEQLRAALTAAQQPDE